MTARMTAFILWSACGGIFALFGVYALHAKEPVRFWNIQEAIQVRNVKKYNHAVAKLWILSAILFVIIGLPLLAKQNSALVVIPILGSMFWAIAQMVLYTRIEKKYRI